MPRPNRTDRMAADLYGEMQLEVHPPQRRWRDFLPGVLVTGIAALPPPASPTIMPPLVLMGR